MKTNWLCIIFIIVSIASCSEKKKTQTVIAEKYETYYTCSMHPQIRETHPGKCPICGMDLIPVSKSSSAMTNEVHLTAEQIRLGDIQVDTTGKSNIGDKLVLTGVLNFNQQKLSSVSARVEGRIQRLYIKAAGEYIHKGDRLYDLYSEPLNNAKQEYIAALQQQENLGNSIINYGAIVGSNKNKLLLLGLTRDQVKELSETKQPSTLTTFYSNMEGYATTINAKEGDYIQEGGTVIELADLTTLWAEAQVYTTQLSSFDYNGKATVQIPDLGKSIAGTIDFVNPEMDPNTRINLVRVSIPNKQNLLHPGMPVYITVQNSERLTITLPRDAVLTNGNGSTVWIRESPGIYAARRVQTGTASGDRVEIISGLARNEAVVTSGAYLLNSEYIFSHGSEPLFQHS